MLSLILAAPLLLAIPPAQDQDAEPKSPSKERVEAAVTALTEAQRPNCTLVFPKIDAHSVGQYLFLMEVAVALMGEFYGVNAFDQPGVEAGKIAAYALMGREGYELRRSEIEGVASDQTPSII